MKKSSLYTLLLLQLSWIVSFAQPGRLDTTRCYGFTELRHIAATAQNLFTCDTLLSSAKKKIEIKDQVITEKDYQIAQHLLTISVKNKIIDMRNDTIAAQKTTIRKQNKAKKALKIGWIVSNGALMLLFIYYLIRG